MSTPTTLTPPPDYPYGYGSPYAPAAAYPPYPPAAPRSRSYLGGLTLSAAVLAFGLLLALDVTDAVDVPAAVLFAVPLGILGLGLVVAAFVGRAMWLLVVALPLLLAAQVAAFVPSHVTIDGRGAVGDSAWRPTTVAAATAGYELSAGDAALDLTAVPITGGTVDVSAEVGAGELRVTVPATATVVVHASVGLGEVRLPGSPGQVERTGGAGVDRDVTLAAAGTSTGTLELDLQVGIGSVEVRRAAA